MLSVTADTFICNLSKVVVLNWRSVLHASPSPRDMWQYLEIFLVVIAGAGGGGVLLVSVCRNQGCC